MGSAAVQTDGFVEKAIKESTRIDGRNLFAARRCNVIFGSSFGTVEVSFGKTRVLCVVSGEVVTPPKDNPNEGKLSFHVNFGPMASPNFEVGRPSLEATTVSNLIERLLKGSRAIDQEALCIVGGQKVWSIRCDLHALDDGGNLGDVAALAALCAMMHFKKAAVDVQGTEATVYTEEEREPVPLSIHHLPIPVTFALFEGDDGQCIHIMDPTSEEEAAMHGSLTCSVNQHGDLCGLHKPGGAPIEVDTLQLLVSMAVKRAEEMTTKIMESLAKDKATRAEKKRNVHSQYKDKDIVTVHVPLPQNVTMSGFGTQDAPMEIDDANDGKGDEMLEIDDDEDVPMKDASPSKRSSAASGSPQRPSVKSPKKESLKPAPKASAPKAAAAAIEVDSDDDLTSAVTKKKKGKKVKK